MDSAVLPHPLLPFTNRLKTWRNADAGKPANRTETLNAILAARGFQIWRTKKATLGLDNKPELALLLRGRRERLSADQQEREWDAVEAHFESVTAGDVEWALSELKYSEVREHREEAAKLLISYFLWCWRTHREVVMRGEHLGVGQREPGPRPRPYGGGRFGADLNTYVMEFAKTVLERIASIPANTYDPEGARKLPKWRRPDSAFGWAEMPGRPPFDTWWRDMGIAACVELYARKGFPWEQAMLKAATKFELSVATVEKALSNGSLISKST